MGSVALTAERVIDASPAEVFGLLGTSGGVSTIHDFV
jgi:uncharacterized protein YndB with AHSA1/START domain